MAALFKERSGIDPVSVDTTRCMWLADNSDADSARFLHNDSGAPVAAGNRALPPDAQVWLPVPAGLSSAESAGFYRKYLGKPVAPPEELLPADTSVLVQAWREGDEELAYDRVLLDAGERLPLFLRAGTYRLVAHGEDGGLVGEAVVVVAE